MENVTQHYVDKAKMEITPLVIYNRFRGTPVRRN